LRALWVLASCLLELGSRFRVLAVLVERPAVFIRIGETGDGDQKHAGAQDAAAQHMRQWNPPSILLCEQTIERRRGGGDFAARDSSRVAARRFPKLVPATRAGYDYDRTLRYYEQIPSAEAQLTMNPSGVIGELLACCRARQDYELD